MARTILGIIISIIIAQMAGAIGSFFTAPNIQSWYAYLEKPSFAPPNWLFAPAWIALYTLMGIAAFLVWSSYAKATDGQAKKEIKTALWLYGVHLLLNALWSVIFFGLQNPAWAFFEILILWALILIITRKFYKIRRAAGILFIPYILWVSFATILNFAIWQLNT